MKSTAVTWTWRRAVGRGAQGWVLEMPRLTPLEAGTMMGRTDTKRPSPGHSVHRHTACDNSQDHEDRRAGFQETVVQKASVSIPEPAASAPGVRAESVLGGEVG